MEFSFLNLDVNIENLYDYSNNSYSFYNHTSCHNFYDSRSILVLNSINLYTAKTVLAESNAINVKYIVKRNLKYTTSQNLQ